MYKMTLNFKDLQFSFESDSMPSGMELDCLTGFVTQAITVTNTCGEMVAKKPTTELTQLLEAQAKPIQETPTAPVEEDEMIIRERLPNRSNVIDLKKIEVSMANGTAHRHFRCPACAQSAVLYANGQRVVRDIVNEDKCFSVEDYSSDSLTYEEACHHTIDEVYFIVGDGMTSKCPSCLFEDKTENFVDAYLNPLKYFESDELCPLCGSELCYNKIDDQEVLACDNQEKDCPYYKPVEKVE